MVVHFEQAGKDSATQTLIKNSSKPCPCVRSYFGMMLPTNCDANMHSNICDAFIVVDTDFVRCPQHTTAVTHATIFEVV